MSNSFPSRFLDFLLIPFCLAWLEKENKKKKGKKKKEREGWEEDGSMLV